MAFNFPVMPRLFMAIQQEDRYPIVDILAQTPEPAETGQWALFLRNHDELTLEMVTDEERDYMYRAYALDPRARINLGIRRRLAPLLGNDRRLIEMMNGLLFSLPGTPVVYYGDEIGMGDNFYLGDRNGVRTPMQWSGDRNAGFSRCNPQRMYLPVIVDPEYHYESRNVEAQQNNQHSLLWWMKRLIALRKRHPAFGRGTIAFLYPSNQKVLAFTRTYEGDTILVVANLSRFVQYVELDLAQWKGRVAVELFGRTPFPPIGALPSLLTLGPHAFYWFELEPRVDATATTAAVEEARPPHLEVRGAWEDVLQDADLVAALPALLRTRRWFGGKAFTIKNTAIVDVLPIEHEDRTIVLAMIRVDYVQAESQTYLWPLAFSSGDAAAALRANAPKSIVAELTLTERSGETVEGIVHGAMEDPQVGDLLLDVIERRRQIRGASGTLVGQTTRAFRGLRGDPDVALPARVLRAEQSNTSVVYGDRVITKLFRRLAEGINPDVEVGRFLTERTRYTHIAPVAGAIELRRAKSEPVTVALLQGYVANATDAWEYTQDQIRHYYDRALATRDDGVVVPDQSILDLTTVDPPPLVAETLGAYIEFARLLGLRTAELHQALASHDDDPAFAPEPFTTLYQRSLYQSWRNLTASVLRVVQDRLSSLPRDVQGDAKRLAGMEKQILSRFHAILGPTIPAMRTRGHGDYHLGQVLWTGKDFVVIDFEGEPARPLSERRSKRSPLRDVAGMLRSFDYAAQTVLRGGAVRPQDRRLLEPWARFWTLWTSSAFLRAYLQQMEGSPLVPRGRDQLARLLDVLVMEKTVYELGYELNNRPAWVRVPLFGLLRTLGA
jgi:maltose alpha-D-glucosyltransferase/alpha-amylase